jgi:5-methylcytosine-specific restriction enzyme A
MTWQHDRRSRHERGYGASWVKIRARILTRDHYLCQPCLAKNRPTPATEVDHVTPKAKGGTDDDDNLQAICHDCHKAKTEVEAAEAQGRKVRRKIGPDGWPA